MIKLIIKHAMTLTVLLSILLFGISSAYFPANIVAGSYYANVITNFSGYGLTTANITVLSKINTTDYYLFSFNDSANGLQLNCTAPYSNGSDSDYFCYCREVVTIVISICTNVIEARISPRDFAC